MNLDSLISLRKALEFAEKELGIDELGETDKKLYYAAIECCNPNGSFSSEEIRSSNWCKDIPHASYHRVLARLTDLGVFSKQQGRQRNLYNLTAYFKI